MTTSPYTRRNPNLMPECIYFYYLTGHSDVRAYVLNYGRMGPVDLQRIIPGIVATIRSGQLRPSGYAFGDIKWRRISYFVAVLDDPAMDFVQGNAFTFILEGSNPEENHSFFDGGDISPFNDVTGFYCINHMLKADGNPTDASPDNYRVIANHTHHMHQDTGTNLGPPISPPP